MTTMDLVKPWTMFEIEGSPFKAKTKWSILEVTYDALRPLSHLAKHLAKCLDMLRLSAL